MMRTAELSSESAVTNTVSAEKHEYFAEDGKQW